MRGTLLLLGFGLTLAIGACTQKDVILEGPHEHGPPATVIMGRILLESQPPTRKAITSSADPKCPQEGLLSADVVVSDGGLENVAVYISAGAEGKVAPAATGIVVMEQTGCQYVPHVLAVQVGQEVKFQNGDKTNHHAHFVDESRDPYGHGKVAVQTSRTFEKPGTYKVKCDVHPWMGAIIHVFDHPFIAVSGIGGRYEIKLPPGKYEVTALHDKYGEKKAELEVKELLNHLDFTFK